MELTKILIYKVCRMGVPQDELITNGATRYEGKRSSKESNSAFAPYPSRKKDTDWPTLVFESGVSESLSRLRIDADWWLTNSEGHVNIVVIIALHRAQSKIQIEKWELALLDPGRPCTRSNQQIPARTQEITINPDTITGAPLVLEFHKIFLRPATLPEIDVIFTAEELSSWAARIWEGRR